MRAGGIPGTPMPLHESEAIILQSHPLGEADRLVSFFARTVGPMRGVAAGARRPKGRFGASLERLSHVRIWFFERETRELVRIRQCEVIESFLDAFGDYDSSVALSLFSEITQAVLPAREAADANYRLLLMATRAVKSTRKPEPALAYFSLWTVRLGGWLPRLEGCGRCGRAFEDGKGAYVSTRAFVFACANCRGAGMHAVSPEVLSAMRRIQVEKLDRIVEAGQQRKGIPEAAARGVTRLMLDLIEQQINRKLAARGLLEPVA